MLLPPTVRGYSCAWDGRRAELAIGPEALTFAPADRITYYLSQTWSLAVEHYADYGSFAHLAPPGRQYHALFGVIDYNSGPLNLEFGIGHGFTAL